MAIATYRAPGNSRGAPVTNGSCHRRASRVRRRSYICREALSYLACSVRQANWDDERSCVRPDRVAKPSDLPTANEVKVASHQKETTS